MFFCLFHPRLSTHQTHNPLKEQRQSSSSIPARQVRRAVTPRPSLSLSFFLTEQALFGSGKGRAQGPQLPHPALHSSARSASRRAARCRQSSPAAQRGFELKAADRRGTAPSERAGSSYSRRAPLGSSPPHSPAGEEMQQRVLLRAARHSAAASGSGCPAPAARPAAASRAGSRRAHVTPAGGARRVTRARATRRAGNSSYRRPRGGSSQRPHAALCARAAVAAAAVDANGSSGFTVSENIANTSAVSLIQAQKTAATST